MELPTQTNIKQWPEEWYTGTGDIGQYFERVPSYVGRKEIGMNKAVESHEEYNEESILQGLVI